MRLFLERGDGEGGTWKVPPFVSRATQDRAELSDCHGLAICLPRGQDTLASGDGGEVADDPIAYFVGAVLLLRLVYDATLRALPVVRFVADAHGRFARRAKVSAAV